MNLKISQRILVSAALPIALLLAFAIWLWQSMTTLGDSLTRVRDESLVFAMTARDMERAVIQVQQFLSDVGATRAQDGLDDGFKQAEKQRAAFLESTARFHRMFTAENEQKGLETVQDIERRFDAYYRAGVATAKAYVDGGPATGNPLMADFDKASEGLQQALRPFIDSQVHEANTAIGNADDLALKVRSVGLILVLVQVAISLVLGWRLIAAIRRPLQQVQGAVERIGAGDLTVVVPVESNDELGEMSAHLNGALEKLRASMQDVVAAAESMARHSEDLASTTGQLKQSSAEQSDAAVHMAANIEEISTSIGQVAANADSTQQISESTLDLVGEGGKVVQNAAAEMGRISASIADSATRITSLSERSAEISGIVGVIKEIADQTNLLALNAAIEAARAGETGRGFAVVADEVRKLAERTALATTEIGTLIEAIRNETTAAVESMESSSAQAGRGVEFADEAGQVFGRITESANQTTAHVREIANSVREQNTASHDVARNVERVAQMTEENSAATQNVAETAGELRKLADRLHAATSHFKT